MPERQNLPDLLSTRQREFAAHVFAERAARIGAHARDVLHPFGHQIDEAVHARRVIARRFALDELANQRNHVFLFLPRIAKKGIHRLL